MANVTANTEFNGMVDSILPSIYINRITLEQTVAQPPAQKNDITPYINLTNPGATVTNLDEDALQVTLDMFIEFPDISGDDFWSFIINDDVIQYLNVKLMLFKGQAGRQIYQALVNQPPSEYQNIMSTMQELITPSVAFGNTVSVQNLINPPDHNVTAANANIIKEQYKKALPDGTVVYKIPVKMSIKMSAPAGTPAGQGAFPSDLCAIVATTMNFESIFEQFATSQNDNNILPDLAEEEVVGRIAKEVIIKDNKVQQKGMLFYISPNQQDEEHEKAFGNLKGQLWFGGVHTHFVDGIKRYMAGNSHINVLHPYLDSVYVPNKKVQDLRLMEIMQKQLLNFNPISTFVMGGTYTNLGSNASPANFDNLPIFSTLTNAVTQGSRIKLFFGIDVGKLLKKHCAVPALLDKMAKKGDPTLTNLIQSGTFLSFKIFRERTDVSNILVNQTGDKKEVYDGTGQSTLFYFKDKTGQKTTTPGGEQPLKATSALVPIPLSTSLTTLGSFMKHYSFTDYEVAEIGEGKFKYSIEIEVLDPTLPFLLQQRSILQDAVTILKEYMRLAQGSDVTNSGALPKFFNPYLGHFTQEFITEAEKLGFATGNIPLEIIDSFEAIKLILYYMRDNHVQPQIEMQDTSDVILDVAIDDVVVSMLDPTSATPDSVTTVYNIYDTITSQLTNFIESFSTTKIPKTTQSTDANGSPILQQFNTELVGASIPQRKIQVKHTFKEIVDASIMEAGYDFLVDIQNASPVDIGLKLINWSAYNQRINDENNFYFKNPDGDFNIQVTFPEAGFTVPTSATIAGPRFLTTRGALIKQIPSVFLPKTIKDINEENTNWMSVANIIRYKNNLFGNVGEDPIGYAKKKSLLVTAGMERVIKEYQILASLGAHFNQQTFSLENVNDPLGSSVLQENILLQDPVKVLLPWGDFELEDFLLALINENYFKLDLYDNNLGTFDTTNPDSPISEFINNNFTLKYRNKVLPATVDKAVAIKEIIDPLPNPIKALLVANGNNSILSNNVNYLGGINPPPVYSFQNKSLRANQYGEIWFRHQNIMEVEYLSGYETYDMNSEASLPSFESVYNATINSPIWSPLTQQALDTLANSDGVILCRLKQYRYDLFNKDAYNLLNLPTYDKYFFITPDGLDLSARTEAINEGVRTEDFVQV